VSERYLPVHPNLTQLKHQAKDLLREMKDARPQAKLAEAQFELARSYGVASWPRLVLACRMVDAICRDDVDAVRALVARHPNLLHEMARGTKDCNWGPPMSYAANLGRDNIIATLRELGATDLTRAMDRAVLQGQIETARRLQAMGARLERGCVMGPCETQSGEGLAYLLQLGAELCDRIGDRSAPLAMLLGTYCRNSQGKHECLELLAAHGVDLPDTATMAIHRGRIDLLEQHLKTDPDLAHRTFSLQEIYPDCGDHDANGNSLGIHGTPLDGTSLLHLCVDQDEPEMLVWLLEHGADANVKASVDADGFGGHTPIFGCVVTAPGMGSSPTLARILLDHGADPSARASLRKDGRDYRDVTPIAWGARFHDRDVVNELAMRLIAERGGHE
jgi:ankyrin repeat protein